MPELKRRVLSEPEFTAIKSKLYAEAPDGLDRENFRRWFKPRFDAALAEAEFTPAPVEGGSVGRFVTNAASMLNPIDMVRGAYGAMRHPIDTAVNLGKAQWDQGVRAVDAAKRGDYVEGAGRLAAGLTPMLGPMAANIGDQIAEGDVAGGLGAATGLLAPTAAGPALKPAANAIAQSPMGPKMVRGLRKGAYGRVADLSTPRVGRQKQRFGNMAKRSAPVVAEAIMEEGAPLTREGLRDLIERRFGDAKLDLNAAADQRMAGRAYAVDDIVAGLQRERDALTAQAVGMRRDTGGPASISKPVPKPIKVVRSLSADAPTSGGYASFASMPERKALGATAGAGTPEATGGFTATIRTPSPENAAYVDGPLRQQRLSKRDVTPMPNRTQAGIIDQALEEINQLGPMAQYDQLRKVRQAYDAMGEVKFNPATTQDFLANKSKATGAAKVGDAMRESMAKMEPETAAANKVYSNWKRARDAAEATSEVESSRPRVGRQIGERIVGGMIGKEAGGVPGMIAGIALSPMIEAVVTKGPTTKLKTARMQLRLADVIEKARAGQPLTAQEMSLLTRIKRLPVITKPGAARLVPGLSMAVSHEQE